MLDILCIPSHLHSPSPQLGDSVVSKGRETLERCIQMVNSNPSWRAQVVYGDTDSLFVLLKGRSKVGAKVTPRVG